jgi:rod shape-determining protein MreC
VLASYPTASQVLLITDITFAAGVISDKNRVHGTVKGLGQSKCQVDFVQNEEKVDVGEMFYTSGDDRVFPKGTPVGRVNVVRPGKTFKEIYIVPSGFQQGLEEVLIVLEGVHQAIPQAQAEAAPGIYMMPPVPQTSSTAPKTAAPATATSATPVGTSSALMTDADRLRERYKRIGEAQRHVFGTGAPGSRPPDFNVDPDAPKPAPPPAAPKSPLTGPPDSQQPGATKPAVPKPPVANPPAAAPNTQQPPVTRPPVSRPPVEVEVTPEPRTAPARENPQVQ